MASNFPKSKLNPFSYTHLLVLEKASWRLIIAALSEFATDVRRPSSTYPRILSPVFLFPPLKTLNSGAVNNINRMEDTGEPCETPISSDCWLPVLPVLDGKMGT